MKTELLENLLKNLNSEQKQAVLHSHSEHNALLILAGAGSGKTSVLTKRIIYRIMQGLPSEQMLALAFTAKAAAEMDERVKAELPNSKALLCTFHSLALRIVKSEVNGIFNYKRLGFEKSPLIKEYSNFAWLDSLMELGIKPNDLDRENLFSPAFNVTKEKAEKLRGKVLKSGDVVFEDLIWLAVFLISEFEEVNLWVKKRWTEILIDEYQDINPSQYAFMRAILGNSNNIFAVGDDDQAIYGFRGADIGNILRFQKDFPNCRVIKLEWNYRSTPRILETANRIFHDKAINFRKNLRPGALRNYPLFWENRKPQVLVSQTAEEEVIKLVDEILFLKNEYSMKYRDFALLSRYNRQRIYYEIVFKEYGIPVVEDDSPPNFDGIQIETLHGSKGLQYPVVFYCGLAETLSPGELPEGRKARKMQLEEEKRLFYVGVTRAEAHLIFLFCKKRYFKGDLIKFKPSRFLKYCKEKNPKTGVRMPILCFKIFAAFKILAYMLSFIPVFVFKRILNKKNAELWLQQVKILDWAKFCLHTMRINLDVRGQEKLAKIDWSRPVIIVANHNSYADIPIVLHSVQRHLGFLAKRELGFIPILSYWMRKIGCIFINRKKTEAARQKFENVCVNKNNAKPPQIVVFPEGTRSKNGKIAPFKSGAFRIACEIKATVLPLFCQGAADTWEKLKKTSEPHSVKVSILDPIDIKEWESENGREMNPKSELMVMVRNQFPRQ